MAEVQASAEKSMPGYAGHDRPGLPSSRDAHVRVQLQGCGRVCLGPCAALWVMFASLSLPTQEFHICQWSRVSQKWALNNHMKLHPGRSRSSVPGLPATTHFCGVRRRATAGLWCARPLGPSGRGFMSLSQRGIPWICCLKGLRLW